MGTCYLSADYEHNVLPLVQKFTTGATKPPPLASVWSNLTPNSSVLFSHYYAAILQQKYGTRNMTAIQGQFVQLIKKYCYLHKSLFGDYYGEIMPEPSMKKMKKIRGIQTFSLLVSQSVRRPIHIIRTFLLGFSRKKFCPHVKDINFYEVDSLGFSGDSHWTIDILNMRLQIYLKNLIGQCLIIYLQTF